MGHMWQRGYFLPHNQSERIDISRTYFDKVVETPCNEMHLFNFFYVSGCIIECIQCTELSIIELYLNKGDVSGAKF